MKDINLLLLEKSDIEMVRRWRNTPDVASFMYSESNIDEEQQIYWFNKISKEKNSIYWIIEFEEQKIGLASLTGIDSALNSCYWAFYLGESTVRGAGIGAKIEFNILDYVFSVLKLNKLRCEVFVSNEKVIKMHEKFGFRREAYYREHCIKNGQKLDVIGLAILSSEWALFRKIMKNKIYGR